jgi:hypothetical protein
MQAQHKECQIAKRDRNDNRIKRRKARERGISFDEDPSPEPSWSGDAPSAAVDWREMSGSSSSLPPCATEVSSSWRPQMAARDMKVGSTSRQPACLVREDQRMVLPRVAPSGTGASETQRAPPRQADPPPPRRSEERAAPVRQLYDGSDRPDSDSLQRRQSRVKSTDSASTPSAPQAVDSSAAPRRLQSLLIRGGGAPDIHVSLVAGGGHGPTPVIAEVGGSGPERSEECIAAIEAADRSGAAPRVGGLQACSPRAGLNGPPDEEVPGALQNVSSRPPSLNHGFFNLFCSQPRFCLLVGMPTTLCSASRP